MTLAEILKRNLIEVRAIAVAVELPPRMFRRACASSGIGLKIGSRWFVRRDEFRAAMPVLWEVLIEKAAENAIDSSGTTKNAPKVARVARTRTCGV